jgi:hypothetical protein
MTIDDELYLSIRIRVPNQMHGREQSDLAARVFTAATEAIADGWQESHRLSHVQITGLEATIATFRPLPDEQGQIMHFTRDKGDGDG